ncbi:hypothetical protein V6N11_030935 [Hibiscus sabdariffa]|uniref:Cytochrome c assembly protein domain-containing protein n=1 Tax=Hibiscus sabdariffa TaxID=183260 RepID=A0ABR2NRV3_9ROSI
MMVPSGSSSSGSAPHEHEPGAPEPEQPLLSDEIRLQELGDRLRINCLGKAMSLGEQEDFVETQLLIEKKDRPSSLFRRIYGSTFFLATGFHFHGFRALYQSFFSRYAAPRARSSRDKRSKNKAGGIPRWRKSFDCVLNIAMAIYLSLRVAPLDLQQGGNSRIPYVHVPAARMGILVYIAMAINTFLFLLTKHPLFIRSSRTSIEIGAFFTLFTLVTWVFWGRPMWGTFWVWDARLTSVFVSVLIYLGALRFQKLPVEPAFISICVGPIDIPIIKSLVNWWNTSHQPGSISRSGTSIHVPMHIPILSNFANFPFSTCILFVLQTRLPIQYFLKSPLTEEIEAQEGIPKPSSLVESFCIHG